MLVLGNALDFFILLFKIIRQRLEKKALKILNTKQSFLISIQRQQKDSGDVSKLVIIVHSFKNMVQE